jgi:hypothetical protein
MLFLLEFPYPGILQQLPGIFLPSLAVKSQGSVVVFVASSGVFDTFAS